MSLSYYTLTLAAPTRPHPRMDEVWNYATKYADMVSINFKPVGEVG